MERSAGPRPSWGAHSRPCVRAPPPTPQVGSHGAQTQGTPKRRLLLRVGSDFSPVCFLRLPETGCVVPTGLQVRCLLQVRGHSSPPNLSPPSRGGGEADRPCREVGQPGGVTRSEAGLGGWQVGLLLQSGSLGEPSRREWHLPSAVCRLVGRTFQHKGPTAGPQQRLRTSHGQWGQGAGGTGCRDRRTGG